eukprot:scaffold124501_cov19-Tisochrysis_lutea.AAC.1
MELARSRCVRKGTEKISLRLSKGCASVLDANLLQNDTLMPQSQGRMNFALKLDEERLAALLASNPQAAHDGKLLGLLMACYG